MRRIVIFLFCLGNEAENRVREFGSALSESDINSGQKRFRTQKVTPVYMRNYILLAVFAGLAVLATAAAGQQPNGEIQREQMTVEDQTQKNADFTGSQRSELKNAEDRAQLAQQNADLAASQRNAMASDLSTGCGNRGKMRRPKWPGWFCQRVLGSGTNREGVSSDGSGLKGVDRGKNLLQ